MNRAVPDEIVEEIRSRSDIVELINSYVPLKKAGAAYKACCPFHSEKTPSFTVTPQRQRYHCFGCGAGGDVFKFVMEREGVDFPTAIHMLATRCGVVIPEREYSSPEERQRAAQNRSMKEKVFEINKLFAEWFMTQLRQNADSPVAQYFRTREIPNDVADTFMIGAAPDSWDSALNYGTGKGYTPDELLTAGIVTQNEQGRIYDRFRNRLVFTILDEQGRPVAFSARTVEKDSQGAKYVNSRKLRFSESLKFFTACIRDARQSMKRVLLFCVKARLILSPCTVPVLPIRSPLREPHLPTSKDES